MSASGLGRLLCALALAVPAGVAAHPMGNFSISHYAAIQVEPDAVRLRYLVDLAEIPTFQALQETPLPLDPRHPAVEAYRARTVETLKDGLTLALDGRRLALRVESSELIFPPGAGGLPTLKVGAVYRAALPPADPAALATLTYRDANYPDRAGWKEIVARGAAGVALVESTAVERDRSRELSDYPTDPTDTPPQALEAQVAFTRVASAPAPASPLAATTAPPSDRPPSPGLAGRTAQSAGRADPAPPAPAPMRADRKDSKDDPAPRARDGLVLTPNVGRGHRDAFTALIAERPVGLGMVLFALAVAASLGAFHALEPGHGKTVVAAYLVGSRGTAAHALLLGLVVTAAHTVGVYLLGAITLYASRHVVPERLYPWLGAASGLLITLLGVCLLWRRLGGPFLVPQGHTHEHGHGGDGHPPLSAAEHGDAHALGREHHHGPEHGHHHHHLPEGPVSLRALVALGVSGGIVPCPAALVVLLSAVAMGRVGFGLLLIVAFSTGLAAVLIAIGLVVVYARRLAARVNRAGVEGPLVRRWLPLTSAAVITASGVVITAQALGS